MTVWYASMNVQGIVHFQLFTLTLPKMVKKYIIYSPDKSNLWYTDSKAKFTQALQMVYTDRSSAIVL